MSKAARAQTAIDTHEKVCAERYGNIDRRLDTIQQTSTNNATQFHDRLNKLETEFTGRLNVISGRMWALIITSFGGTVIGLATLVFYLITTKGHG